MLRFVELEDGTFRMEYERNGEGYQFKYKARFQQIENDDELSEKEKGFKLMLDNKDE